MKIRGVVDASGGASATDDGPWLLRLKLSPWRNAEGELIDGRVTVWRSCSTDAALKAAEAEQRPGCLVEVEVEAPERLSGLEFRLRGPHEFLYVDHTGVEDDELERFARELAPPAEITDAVLGAFVFDARLRWYTGCHCSASGASYRIRVTPPDRRRPGPRIEQARAIVAWVDEHRSEIARAAADALWPLWDGTWRQDDEDDIDREDFERRLSLESISWDDGHEAGEFAIYFDDGDLFGGHAIVVGVKSFAVRGVELYG